MGNSRPLDLWMLMICTPPEDAPEAVTGCSPLSSRRRRWVTKANSPLYPALSKLLACSQRATRFSRRLPPPDMAPNTPRTFHWLYIRQISRWTLISLARLRRSASRVRNSSQSSSPKAARASQKSPSGCLPRIRASRSGEKPAKGERSTAMRGTSCRGLSRISSREHITATSMEEKKSSFSWVAQGMPRSVSALAQWRSRGPGERIRITMSSARQGRSSPESSSVTGNPSDSRAAIRSAAICASSSAAGTFSASPSSWGGRSRWNSVRQSSRGGRQAAPKYSRSASPYSTSPISRLMMAENTKLAASSTSFRERKFWLRRILRGSPSSASAASGYRRYCSRKMVGSARRKRQMDCFTSPTVKRLRPPRARASKMQFCT